MRASGTQPASEINRQSLESRQSNHGEEQGGKAEFREFRRNRQSRRVSWVDSARCAGCRPDRPSNVRRPKEPVKYGRRSAFGFRPEVAANSGWKVLQAGAFRIQKKREELCPMLGGEMLARIHRTSVSIKSRILCAPDGESGREIPARESQAPKGSPWKSDRKWCTLKWVAAA